MINFLFRSIPSDARYRVVAGIVLLTLLSSCFLLNKTENISTGLLRETLADGSINLVVTARASQNARDKKSAAMMQATSCKAAKDMIQYELKNGFYENIQKNYINEKVELINAGEYCRIYGNFNPGGHSQERTQKAIPMNSLN